jgi:metal-responsive CopG/Arc/MetJ family transcriptional regulator
LRWDPGFFVSFNLVIPGYTWVMKTAISLPDGTFDRASRRAKELGMSRSEFFARAAVNYLDELDAKSLTAQLDASLELIGKMDESTDVAVAVGRRVLGDTDEW